MKKEPRPIIHIGMHKSLSSWLQHEVFKPSGPVFTPDVRIRDMVHRLVTVRTSEQPPVDWQVEMAKVRSAGKQTGLSVERLSGYPAMGLFGRREIVENLAADYPDAQILIVIREQVNVIASYYQQYLHDGGSLSLKEFLNPRDLHDVVRAPRFDYRYFCYSSLIQQYADIFGEDSVHVLPYEYFVRDSKSWIRDFEVKFDVDLIGCDPQKRVNSARDLPTQWAHRLLNSTIAKTQLSPGGLTSSESPRKVIERLSPHLKRLQFKKLKDSVNRRRMEIIKNSVAGCYESDNLVVSEKIGISLAEFDYAVSSHPDQHE